MILRNDNLVNLKLLVARSYCFHNTEGLTLGHVATFSKTRESEPALYCCSLFRSLSQQC